MRSTLVSDGSVVHRAVRLTLGWLLIGTAVFPAVTSCSITAARADLLEYTYTGNPYTLFNTHPGNAGYPYFSNSPNPNSIDADPYSGSNAISGSVIIDTGSGDISAATYGIQEFSLSDGITTYSGPPGNNGTGEFQVFGSLTIDNTGNVTDSSFYVSTSDSNGFSRLFSSSVVSSTVPVVGGGMAPYYAGADAFLSDGSDFEALSETPGTWSAPIDLSTGGGSGGNGGGSGGTGSSGGSGSGGGGGSGGSTGGSGSGSSGAGSSPSLYLTVNTGGPNSASGDPTSMNASLTVATAPPAANSLQFLLRFRVTRQHSSKWRMIYTFKV